MLDKSKEQGRMTRVVSGIVPFDLPSRLASVSMPGDFVATSLLPLAAVWASEGALPDVLC